MDRYREAGTVDPDYESYNSALELNKEEDKKENLLKLKKIIEDEYNIEISQREDQIEKIELQICKVRKLLHLLRYALIMSYYKKQELEHSEEEPTTSESIFIPDKQNRIHPAIKRLLGANGNIDHLTTKDKRKTKIKHVLSHKIEESSEEMPHCKKIKLDTEDIVKSESFQEEVKMEINVQNRTKSKFRIIVGNISKWMPSSEDDLLTHKWMVYVRGPKNNPNVSSFIEKVVYYLHPSYRPYDVVTIGEPPFHLSRRGWGEFPVRVQIFFKISLNKPIDVVHNIKLDKTYSGRQTLGNETIVDVFLYDNNTVETSDIKSEETEIKIENDIYAEEHDYCGESITNESAIQNDSSNYDHEYCQSSSNEGLPKTKTEKIEQDMSNSLIYGLENYCNGTVNRSIITANHLKQLVLNKTDIKTYNAKIIVLGKKVEIKNKKTFYEIECPKNRFRNMGEALPYLFKRLPLCSELAKTASYKRIYPFTATSLKEFVSWNVGKRRSSEWSRARVIRQKLEIAQISGIHDWTTKTILMYGRSHDFTPYCSYGLFERNSFEKNLINNCFRGNGTISKNYFTDLGNHDNNEEVTVDIDSETETLKKKPDVSIDISDPRFKMEYSYIRHSALEYGIILKPEKLIEGVKVNGAEMMILEAVKSLANNLIRRAKNHRICMRTHSSNTSAINKEDVEVAINERPELSKICKYKDITNWEYRL